MGQKLTAIGLQGGTPGLVRRFTLNGVTDMNMRILALSGLAALGATAAAPVAQAMPAASLERSASGLGAVSVVRHRGRPHRTYRRPRLYVTPRAYGYPYYGYVGAPLPAQLYYPTARGFEDPGYAYHGNISGCATDLGYGRWESCDQ
jgi:hypothetical protein